MKIPDFTGTKLKLYAIVAIGLLLLMVAIGITAFFAGKRDQKDAQAAQDIKALTTALQQATKDLKAQQAGMADALHRASEAQSKVSAIGARVADQQLNQERFAHENRNSLERSISVRTDLDGVRVGADILCAWNRANAGADSAGASGTAAAVALPGCQPAEAVSGAAAGARRPAADSAQKPAGRR